MKTYFNILFLSIIITLNVACNKKDNNIPRPPDYSKTEYWFGNIEQQGNKAIDIFYVYPSLGFAEISKKGDTLYYADISKQSERNKAFDNQKMNQLVYAEDKYNFYAPFYRQLYIDAFINYDSMTLAKKINICLEDIKNALTEDGMKEKRIIQVRKRDGRIVKFERERIETGIFKAAENVGGKDRQRAVEITDEKHRN